MDNTGHPCPAAGRRPNGIWAWPSRTFRRRSRLCKRFNNDLVRRAVGFTTGALALLAHTPAQALSHGCAARRSPGSAHRNGSFPVFACASWLHRGGMAAPSPWRCRCQTACFPRLRLWIGHCLWQDGTRALERALPTSKHSPDRACVLCSMHRLAWNTLETGLDETRATSSIVKAAIRACNFHGNFS